MPPPVATAPAQTRWTLPAIGAACPWPAPPSPSGCWRMLTALGFGRRRARAHIHSPDPHYAAKVAAIAAIRADAVRAWQQGDERLVVVYVDEATLYRQPTLADAWWPDTPLARSTAQPLQPLARRSHRSDTPAVRLMAALEPTTGRVVARRSRRLQVADLVAFWANLAAAYPRAKRLVVILDNWPMHVHPDSLVALQPQTGRWVPRRPPSWGAAPHAPAVRRWGDWELPIELVWLPTYAPWLNPVEKLWRGLRQTVGHLHPFANDLPGLGLACDAWLGQYAQGSVPLLRAVGLGGPPR